jgi:hypothetical protein
MRGSDMGSPVKPENDNKKKHVDGRDERGHDGLGGKGKAGEMCASRRVKPERD